MASLADRLTDLAVRIADEFKKRPVLGSIPPVGWIASPAGALSTAAATPTTGRLVLHPIDLPYAMTVDALVCNVGTAGVGGTYTVHLGLYPSDAEGMPLLTNGPVIPATALVTSSTGIKTQTITPVALKAGRYWTASLYVVTSAPSTAPQLHGNSNATASVPRPTSQGPSGGAIKGYYVNAQTTIGAVASPTFTVIGDNSCVLVGLRRG